MLGKNVALIKSETGVVENIIVVGESYNPPMGYEVQPLPNYPINKGYTWDGETFIKTIIEPIVEPEVTTPTALEELTNYVLDVDFRVVMLEMGL